MPAVKDPYKVLGVDKKASDDEIKKAYRKLARDYHPDRNPGDASAEERFKDVQEAYSILSDPEKRRAYDTGGGIFGGGFDPGNFREGFGGFGGGIGDILSDLFGGAGRPGGGPGGARAPQRGRDLETEVHVSFDQAMEGAQVPVSVPMSAPCTTCHGTGAKPGTSPTVCSRCQGRGVEAESQGLFSISQPCQKCGGTGTEIKDPCPTCGGQGRTRQVKRYRVNIPAGVRDGSRVRLAGKGEPGGRGGPAGDLYVITRVGESPIFKRKGDNLEVDVPDHDRRGHPRRHDRGAHSQRHQADPRAAGHPARHRAAPARRGVAAAGRPRPGRHPLQAPDRRSSLPLAGAAGGRRRAGGGNGRQST